MARGINMSIKRSVMIWRDDILGGSETFIANQVQAMRRWEASFAGFRYVPNQFDIHPKVEAKGLSDPSLLSLVEQSDLVHAHFAPGGIHMSQLSYDARVPLVVTFHGYDVAVYHLWWGPFARRRLRLMFKRATVLIAVSEFIAGRLRSLGAPEEKIVVHHIGIPIPPDDVDRTKRSGVLFVGRLVEKKGADDLLAAMALLEGGLRSTEVLVIGEGPARKKLERQAQALSLNVRFLGSLPNHDVRAHMRRAAVLCGPSRRALNGDAEGLPITILEAAAHRLPIVATTASGIPEAVIDGVTGLLVPERSRKKLAAALASLLADDELQDRFASASRKYVEKNFDVSVQTTKLEEIYDRAVAARI